MNSEEAFRIFYERYGEGEKGGLKQGRKKESGEREKKGGKEEGRENKI